MKFKFWLVTKSWNHLSFVNISSYIGNWYINGKVFTGTTPWKPKNLIFFFFKKVWNSNFDLWWRAEITIASSTSVPTLVIDTSMERSSPVATTPWQHKNLNIFQKSLKFEFWLVMKSWNHLSFVNISLTLVIDTLMERSSWVASS